MLINLAITEPHLGIFFWSILTHHLMVDLIIKVLTLQNWILLDWGFSICCPKVIKVALL